MYQPRPLRDYPAATLDALHGAITALLGYQDMLPTDLSVKLSLLRDDVAKATSPSPRPAVAPASHPVGPARLRATGPPREPNARHDHPLPGRHPR